jgi:uncharacterized protein (TIGR02300 family)
MAPRLSGRPYKDHTVAKPELGTKRTCPVTGRKFYDLDKDPIVSPYTGTSYPRSAFEVPVRGAPKIAQAVTDEEASPELEEADAELVPLEEADAEESATGAKTAAVVDDDIEIEDEAADEEDTFLEEEEDEDTDVADLIDGDIEGEEEP